MNSTWNDVVETSIDEFKKMIDEGDFKSVRDYLTSNHLTFGQIVNALDGEYTDKLCSLMEKHAPKKPAVKMIDLETVRKHRSLFEQIKEMYPNEMLQEKLQTDFKDCHHPIRFYMLIENRIYIAKSVDFNKFENDLKSLNIDPTTFWNKMEEYKNQHDTN